MPEETEVQWYYALDTDVTGKFGAGGRVPNQNLPEKF